MPKPTLPSIGLSTKFTVLILVGFLLTAAGAYLSFEWMLDGIVAELGTLFAEKQVLYDRERSLRPILREVTIAQKLATSPTMLAWAADEENPALKRRGLAELENFRQAFADKSYFFALRASGHYYFNDAQGQYTGRELRYTLHEHNPENAWFYRTLRMGEPCLLNVDHDAKLDVTKLWINCVIHDGTRPVGIIGSGIDLTSFIRNVIEDTPHDIVNIFIDSSGAIQAHRNPKLIDFRSISKKEEERKKIFELLDHPREQERLRQIMAELKGGGPLVRTLFVDIGGRKYLAGLAYIQEFGWYNVTLMGIGSRVTKAYFAPIAGVFAAALTAFLVIVALVFKWLILDRVSRLDASVRQVAACNFDIQLDDSGRDEIGRLAREFRAMAVTVQDTTQNLEERVRQRTAELAEANATKDKFFSIIAHDLRGPVGNVRNLIREQRPGEPMEPTLLEASRGSADYAYDLLENLLQWASSQMGHLKPDPVRFDVHMELTLTLAGLKALAARKSIAIESVIPERLEAVGDLEMVKTIVRNLVVNAIKFSPEGTTVTVSAREHLGGVRIDVRDQGVGMPPEAVAKLFKVGELSASTLGTHKERGAGLGLILCKELAVRNRGDISVQSAPGQGSTFTLTLPGAAALAEAAPPP